MPKSASSSISKRFDYDSLNTVDAVFVQQRTNEIRGLMKRTAEDIVDIGRRLIEVKQRLKHGRFGTWLTAEFGWNQKTAERFMNVAESFQSKFDNLSVFDLAPSALYILAAPSTPAEAREEAIARAQSGQSITYTAAKNLKQKYSLPKHQLENFPPSLEQPSSQAAKPSVAQSGVAQLAGVKQPSLEPGGALESNLSTSRATAADVEPTQTKFSEAEPSTQPSYALPSAPASSRQRVTDPVQRRLEIMAIRPKEADLEVSLEDKVERVAPTERPTARFIQPGTWWQFGEQHLLYYGDPASSRFRERLPERVALSLAFPASREAWPQRPEATTGSSFSWYTQHSDQDMETLYKGIEQFLLLATSSGEPVVFSFLPDPEILLLAHKLECRWMCAEPDPLKCEAAIVAWRGKGFRVEKVTGLRF